MIAHLTGRPVHADADSVVLDVQGVGYLVRATTSVIRAAATLKAASMSVFIHTSVREDAIQLFGFATLSEQRLFERLLTLQGVGPKVALAIVSTYEPTDIRRAVENDDVALMQSVPGVGPKVARRIVTELRDKLNDIVPALTVLNATGGDLVPSDHTYYDARDALVELGIPLASAEAALRETDSDAPVSDRIRHALQVART
ncbi:MAG: Holliday junction branch migration protein RuvA [Thermoleophilia bacterium]|nr:Holliday junction branch migration protein RuvA [Thermoleophilia bacterium]